jgi:hypothetical protein
MKFEFFTDFLIFGSFFCVVGRFGVVVCSALFVVCGLWFVVCGLWFVECRVLNKIDRFLKLVLTDGTDFHGYIFITTEARRAQRNFGRIVYQRGTEVTAFLIFGAFFCVDGRFLWVGPSNIVLLIFNF